MGKDYGMDVGVEGEIVWFATVSLNRQIYYFRSIVCSLSGSWVESLGRKKSLSSLYCVGQEK